MTEGLGNNKTMAIKNTYKSLNGKQQRNKNLENTLQAQGDKINRQQTIDNEQ